MKIEFDTYEKEYFFSFELMSEIKALKDILNNLNKPFIFSASTLDNDFLTLDYHDSSIYRSTLRNVVLKNTNTDNIWKAAEVACIKDEVWGKWRNRDLNDEYFYKFTFTSEYQERFRKIFENWLEIFEKALKEMEIEEENRKRLKQERKNNYNVVKIFKITYPKGGENGTDGYADVLIRNNKTHLETRMVARNVFDFGFYVYPKRIEGINGVFNEEIWNSEEKEAGKWLHEFSPFTTNIRV